MNRYHVGIVGYGWAAEADIAAVNATSPGQVTAICSSRPPDAAALSARHGRCRTLPSRLLHVRTRVIFAADRSAETGRPVNP